MQKDDSKGLFFVGWGLFILGMAILLTGFVMMWNQAKPSLYQVSLMNERQLLQDIRDFSANIRAYLVALGFIFSGSFLIKLSTKNRNSEK